QLTQDGATGYTYDDAGNRTMAGYQTGTANRISNDGTFTYTYDNEGDLTQKSKGSGLETWYYGYDHRNLLTSVRKTSNGSTDTLTVTYTYDVLGRLVQEADWPPGGSATTARYGVDDLGEVWAELSSGNDVMVRYISGDGKVEHVAITDGSGLAWYVADHLGSERDVVNGSGVQDHVEYAAYGAVSSETNVGLGGPWRYTGLRENQTTGIVVADRRTLLVTTGQWMQDDPIMFQAGDANVRRYAGNTPTNMTDPT